MSEIKERPIIFSGEMVRAILDGRKTQTRRVIKPQPPPETNECCQVLTDTSCWIFCDSGGEDSWRTTDEFKCPYGEPGDELWVREKFRYCQVDDDHSIQFAADGLHREVDGIPLPTNIRDVIVAKCLHDGDSSAAFSWKPSIHMPRWASRIQLLITDVRVERVKDISEGDAYHEGVALPEPELQTYYSEFKQLWDSINGKKPGLTWDDSPWVWVVEFERIEV